MLKIATQPEGHAAAGAADGSVPAGAVLHGERGAGAARSPRATCATAPAATPIYTTYSLLGELEGGAFSFDADTRLVEDPARLAAAKTLWMPRGDTLDPVFAQRVADWVRAGGHPDRDRPRRLHPHPDGRLAGRRARHADRRAPRAAAGRHGARGAARGPRAPARPTTCSPCRSTPPAPRAFASVPAGASVVARFIDGAPAAILRQVGAGRVLAFSADLMAPSVLDGPLDLARFVGDIQRWAGGTPRRRPRGATASRATRSPTGFPGRTRSPPRRRARACEGPDPAHRVMSGRSPRVERSDGRGGHGTTRARGGRAGGAGGGDRGRGGGGGALGRRRLGARSAPSPPSRTTTCRSIPLDTIPGAARPARRDRRDHDARQPLLGRHRPRQARRPGQPGRSGLRLLARRPDHARPGTAPHHADRLGLRHARVGDLATAAHAAQRPSTPAPRTRPPSAPSWAPWPRGTRATSRRRAARSCPEVRPLRDLERAQPAALLRPPVRGDERRWRSTPTRRWTGRPTPRSRRPTRRRRDRRRGRPAQQHEPRRASAPSTG